MKYLIPFLVSLFCLLSISVCADLVELKDGTRLSGNVMNFTDTSIIMEVNGASRSILNADVSKINGQTFDAQLTIVPSAVATESDDKDEKRDPTEVMADFQKNFSKQTSALSEELKKTFAGDPKTGRRSAADSIKELPPGALPIILGAAVFLYIFLILPYFLMAQKIGLSGGWQFVTWVPFFQLFAFLRIADKPLWWAFLFLIPLLNIVLMIAMYCGMSERCGKEKWLGLLMLVPVVSLFFPWYLALTAKPPEAASKNPSAPQTPPVSSGIPQRKFSITPFDNEQTPPSKT